MAQADALVAAQVGQGFRPFPPFLFKLVPDHCGWVPFNGGTRSAQVTILLHEFAHTINLVPPDRNSTVQSNANTETVLKNCRQQIGRIR